TGWTRTGPSWQWRWPAATATAACVTSAVATGTRPHAHAESRMVPNRGSGNCWTAWSPRSQASNGNCRTVSPTVWPAASSPGCGIRHDGSLASGPRADESVGIARQGCRAPLRATICKGRDAPTRRAGAPPSARDHPSTLDAHHLSQRVHHLHQVRLRRHHRVDVLVGGRRFVDHGLVLAALDMRGGLAVLLERDAAAGGGAAHHPAGAVAAAVEAVLVTEAAHDEALRAHAAGNDAELVPACAHRALARHQHLAAGVRLLLHVVVVAVHRHGLQPELRQFGAHRMQHALHHRLAVGARVVLGPAHGLDVVVEQRLAFHEEGQVLVGHVVAEHALAQFLARALDEVAADQVAGAARARVQHHPHRIALVQADLDEVV